MLVLPVRRTVTAPRPLPGGARPAFLDPTEAASKAVVRRRVAEFDRVDLAELEPLLAPDAVVQGVCGQGALAHLEPIWRQLVEGCAVQLELQGLAAEGDVAAARCVARGSFRAPALGRQPTGCSYELVAVERFVTEEGGIPQRWGARDAAVQARQLGIPLDA